MMVGIASAVPPTPYHINGVFTVTGISSCSPEGVPASPGVFEGDYTFRPDGIVTISNGFVRNIPPGPTMAVIAEFKYTVTRAGRIEFQYPEGGFEMGTLDADGHFISFGRLMNIGPSAMGLSLRTARQLQ